MKNKHTFEAKGVFAWITFALIMWVPVSIVLILR